MGYIFLIGAVVLDSLGIALLNKADGISNLKFLLSGLLFLNLGLVSFSISLKTLDLTLANTTWAGLNILLVAIIGYFYFDEKYTLIQYLLIGLVICGLTALNLSGVSR